jgi:hypothetical protein
MDLGKLVFSSVFKIFLQSFTHTLIALHMVYKTFATKFTNVYTNTNFAFQVEIFPTYEMKI